MYPLKFAPVYKQIVWGGSNIQEYFGRKTPFEKVAESWELCSRDDGMSIVTNGELAGQTLAEVIDKFGAKLLGKKVFDRYGSFFPLLIKIIDANDRLSVQVHPNDEYAKTVGEPNGKNEMWYIIDAKKDAKLIYGLKENITKECFSKAVEEKRIGDTLNEISVKPGDVIYIPAGTVHAILDGILIAEIQQNSNTTYRIYDWDRVGAQGKGRELHIQRALDVIDFSADRRPERGRITEQCGDYSKKEMLRTDFFNIDELSLSGTYSSKTDGDSFIVLMNLKGRSVLSYDGGSMELEAGETVLIGAEQGTYKLTGNSKILLSSI